MTGLARWVERAWAGENFVDRVARASLAPAALLFGVGARARVAAYRFGIARARRAGVPVVSVGNLSVGGTGKTPTALWLAEELRAKGRRAAIVTRGYGAGATEARIVQRGEAGEDRSNVDWRQVGDEPALLAMRYDGPVVVSPNRADGAALAIEELRAEVILLDDGFQHLALERDFDLVLVRAGSLRRPALLPAGPFREPPSALRRADAVVLTKGRGVADRSRIEAAAPGVPIFEGELAPSALVTIREGRWQELPLGRVSEQRVLAVCGIGDPAPFYQMFEDWECRVEDCLEYPDHHPYGPEDWKRISNVARNCDLVVTTEKDLVKLAAFPFAREKLVAVRVAMAVSEGETLVQSIIDRIDERAGRKPAGITGRTT